MQNRPESARECQVPEIAHRKRTREDRSSSKSTNVTAGKNVNIGAKNNDEDSVGVTKSSFNDRLECTNSASSVFKVRLPLESREGSSKDAEDVVLVGGDDCVQMTTTKKTA